MFYARKFAGLGARGADRGRYGDGRLRPSPAGRRADRIPAWLRRDGDCDDRVCGFLPDVRHDRPPAAVAMIGAVRTGRCDPGLIEAARCGDEKALVLLIAAAQPDVRRYAARNCRVSDIDDAVQETLLLLYRRIGTLRAVTSFSAWLFSIAETPVTGCCVWPSGSRTNPGRRRSAAFAFAPGGHPDRPWSRDPVAARALSRSDPASRYRGNVDR